MKLFCPRCAVEVQEGLVRCPLCQSLLQDHEKGLAPLSQPYPAEPEVFPDKRDLLIKHRARILLILTVSLIIPALVCMLVDYLYTGGTWAAWVVYSLGLTWSLVFLYLAFIHNALLTFIAQMFSVGFFLWAIDLLDGTLTWSLPLAIPILAWIIAAGFLIWATFQCLKGKFGFLIVGILAGVQVVCFGVELSIQEYLWGNLSLRWSLIVLAALGPLMIFSLIIQILFLKSPRFKRFFHW